MTEGRLAGRSTPVEVVITPTVQPKEGISSESVSYDVLRYFGIGLDTDNKSMDRLKEVSKWAFDGVDTVGDGLTKLKKLELKLGMPSGSETRYDKIYNWIKIQSRIDDLIKQQEALR